MYEYGSSNALKILLVSVPAKLERAEPGFISREADRGPNHTPQTRTTAIISSCGSRGVRVVVRSRGALNSTATDDPSDFATQCDHFLQTTPRVLQHRLIRRPEVQVNSNAQHAESITRGSIRIHEIPDATRACTWSTPYLSSQPFITPTAMECENMAVPDVSSHVELSFSRL